MAKGACWERSAAGPIRDVPSTTPANAGYPHPLSARIPDRPLGLHLKPSLRTQLATSSPRFGARYTSSPTVVSSASRGKSVVTLLSADRSLPGFYGGQTRHGSEVAGVERRHLAGTLQGGGGHDEVVVADPLAGGLQLRPLWDSGWDSGT